MVRYGFEDSAEVWVLPLKYLRGIHRVGKSETAVIAKVDCQETVFHLRDILRVG